jgi:putative hydrolase of HD superfamily
VELADAANLAKYLYEVGHLKQVQRSGWQQIGIHNPESVAEHSYRTAIIGYILASIEGADPEKTAIICLFHDAAEARIGDLHWTAKRYINVKEGEQLALTEQVERLPQEMAEKVVTLVNEYEERSSREGRLAREADLLECILQAREYQTRGYAEAQDWIDGCYESLQTETGRSLAKACIHTEPSAWFQGLKYKPKP